jgi:hypothetical protein
MFEKYLILAVLCANPTGEDYLKFIVIKDVILSLQGGRAVLLLQEGPSLDAVDFLQKTCSPEEYLPFGDERMVVYRIQEESYGKFSGLVEPLDVVTPARSKASSSRMGLFLRSSRKNTSSFLSRSKLNKA